MHRLRETRTLRRLWLFLLVASVTLAAGQVTPALSDTPHTVTHYAGDTAVLFCSVDNLGHHTVTWRKLPNSAPLTIGSRTWTPDHRLHAEHVPNSSHWNLVIERIEAGDEGEYECQVSHRNYPLRHRVKLLVKEKPRMFLPRIFSSGIEISGENVLRAGSTLILTCNATLVDVGLERIGWFKDNKQILLDDSRRYSVYTSVTLTGQSSGLISSKLQIRATTPADSGIYVCRSSERAQMAGVKVDIQGKNNYKRDHGEKYYGYGDGFSGMPSRHDREDNRDNASTVLSTPSVTVLACCCILFQFFM